MKPPGPGFKPHSLPRPAPARPSSPARTPRDSKGPEGDPRGRTGTPAGSGRMRDNAGHERLPSSSPSTPPRRRPGWRNPEYRATAGSQRRRHASASGRRCHCPQGLGGGTGGTPGGTRPPPVGGKFRGWRGFAAVRVCGLGDPGALRGRRVARTTGPGSRRDRR